MSWIDAIDFSKFHIVVSPFGGPIATLLNETNYLRGNFSMKPYIHIYSNFGCEIGKIRLDAYLTYFGWPYYFENLICVQDDGMILIYDIFGQFIKNFAFFDSSFLKQSNIYQREIIDCQMLNFGLNVNDPKNCKTTLVLLVKQANEYSIYYCDNILETNVRIKRFGFSQKVSYLLGQSIKTHDLFNSEHSPILATIEKPLWHIFMNTKQEPLLFVTSKDKEQPSLCFIENTTGNEYKFHMFVAPAAKFQNKLIENRVPEIRRFAVNYDGATILFLTEKSAVSATATTAPSSPEIFIGKLDFGGSIQPSYRTLQIIKLHSEVIVPQPWDSFRWCGPNSFCFPLPPNASHLRIYRILSGNEKNSSVNSIEPSSLTTSELQDSDSKISKILPGGSSMEKKLPPLNDTSSYIDLPIDDLDESVTTTSTTTTTGNFKRFILHPEPDGCRIITPYANYFANEVPSSLVDICKIGSLLPAAFLYNASELFHNATANSFGDIVRSDEYLRAIITTTATIAKGERNSSFKAKYGPLYEAIYTCLVAALQHYDPLFQMKFLQAARFGNQFMSVDSSTSLESSFDRKDLTLRSWNKSKITAQIELQVTKFACAIRTSALTLRILNNLRHPGITGIPITFNQYLYISSPSGFNQLCRTTTGTSKMFNLDEILSLKEGRLDFIIEKLLTRKHFALALEISESIQPASPLTSYIFHRWACYKTRQSNVTDRELAKIIAAKIGPSGGVSYTEIAHHALQVGRPDLARLLSGYEVNLTSKMSLLLGMGDFELAFNQIGSTKLSSPPFVFIDHLWNAELLYLLLTKAYGHYLKVAVGESTTATSVTAIPSPVSVGEALKTLSNLVFRTTSPVFVKAFPPFVIKYRKIFRAFRIPDTNATGADLIDYDSIFVNVLVEFYGKSGVNSCVQGYRELMAHAFSFLQPSNSNTVIKRRTDKRDIDNTSYVSSIRFVNKAIALLQVLNEPRNSPSQNGPGAIIDKPSIEIDRATTLSTVASLNKQAGDVKKWLKLREQYHSDSCSLYDFLQDLLKARKYKEADTIRKDFGMLDKRYNWLKLDAVLQGQDWDELERMEKSKTTFPSYETCVDTCIKYKYWNKAKKYAHKIGNENKLRYYVKTDLWDEAVDFAVKNKSKEDLSSILTHYIPVKALWVGQDNTRLRRVKEKVLKNIDQLKN